MALLQKILHDPFALIDDRWISPDVSGDQRRDLRSGGKYIFNDTDNRVVHDPGVGTNQKFTYLVKAKITDSGVLIGGWGDQDGTLYVTTSSITCARSSSNTDPNELTGLTLNDDFHRMAVKADWTSTPYAQRIWIDGVEQTFNATTFNARSADRQVGGRDGSLYFGGEIAEYAAYEDLLSDAEIDAWSAGGDPPAVKTANDVICHCDEGVGTTAYDVSGNENHGTIAGTLTSFHDTDISLRSWHNEVGYNQNLELSCEQVANGTFDTGSDWTALNNGTISISGGTLTLDGSDPVVNSTVYAVQDCLIVGKKYRFSGDVLSITGGFAGGSSNMVDTNTIVGTRLLTSPGSFDFTAVATDTVLRVLASDGETVEYDNISVVEVEADLDAYVPRLETAANQALAPASQTDVLGNALTYYGRAKYDGLLKSGCVLGNGTDIAGSASPTGLGAGTFLLSVYFHWRG